MEGGEKIAEEEEGDENSSTGPRSNDPSTSRSGNQSSASSPSKLSDKIFVSDSGNSTDKRRKFEDAKEELLNLTKTKGIGLREMKIEFAKMTGIKKSEYRRKMLALGFKTDEISDEKINVLFSGLEDGSNGCITSEKLLNMFEAEIEEDHMACEIPEVEDDNVPEKLHQEGILNIELRGAKDLLMNNQHEHTSSRKWQPKVMFPPVAYSAGENSLRRQLAADIYLQNMSLNYHLAGFLKRSGLTAGSFNKQNRTAAILQEQMRLQQMSSPVEFFFDLLETQFVASKRNLALAEATQDSVSTTNWVSSPLASRVPMSSAGGTATNRFNRAPIVSTPLMLHKTDRMKELEKKRSEKLAFLQKKKQNSLGDKQKTSALPRLIGGRKSGSNHVLCIECGCRILVAGRRDLSSDGSSECVTCGGSNCMNVFCKYCYLVLPEGKKLCEDCFEHELVPPEKFGEELRAILIEKIGSSDQQLEMMTKTFQSFDKDNSGTLDSSEFEQGLLLLNIQPPLSDDQRMFLMTQFDTNCDGVISFDEIKDWLVKNQVWKPSVDNSYEILLSPHCGSKTVVQNQHDIVSSALDYLINTAFDAVVFSSSTAAWVRTDNATSTTSVRVWTESNIAREGRSEIGFLIFQKAMNLPLSDGLDEDESVGSDAVQRIFDRFDADGSGKIDLDEFMSLLSTLGLHLTATDARLLMHRVEASNEINELLDFSEFMAYIEKITQLQQPQIERVELCDLARILIQIDETLAKDSQKREQLREILLQLQWNMRETDLISCCKQIRREIGIFVEVEDLQRLTNAFLFRDFNSLVPAKTSITNEPNAKVDKSIEVNTKLTNSGDTLAFLVDSPSLLSHMRAFDVQIVCDQVATHLENQTSTRNIESIWKSVFGLELGEFIDQRDFLDVLFRAGFDYRPVSAADESIRMLTTRVIISIALDALRCESGVGFANDEWSGYVTFSLFTVLLRRSQINEIETKFGQALNNILRLAQGHQSVLVSVALEERNLVVRAKDPVFKFEMDYTLSEQEYTRPTLINQLYDGARRALSSTNGSREEVFTANPYGLITENNLPQLHDAITALLSRLRISTTDHPTNQGIAQYLTLVESKQFVLTLREHLAQARLPFFWSVSCRVLDFAIDGDYLAQLNCPSFLQVVAQAITKKTATSRALLATLKHVTSSLIVRYEVIGKNITFTSTWADLQALLSGRQDTYAIIEVRPQGDATTTRIDRTGGNGSPSWNFKWDIFLKEPELCDQRVDRTVVFTDTVKVSSAPNGDSTRKIAFLPNDQKTSNSTFLIVNVRKALPSNRNEQPRLYCTAYDPFTSCDYSVEGYPANWSVDFFNSSENPDFERQWQELLKAMSLGMTLTPKIVVKVFNKQQKTDHLLGECEVAITSAIAHEGFVFDDWFALQHPIDHTKITGYINMAFHFDVKNSNDRDEPISVPCVMPVEVRIDQITSEVTEAPRKQQPTPNDGNAYKRIQDLEKALELSENIKLEAQEQAKNLKTQLQQLSLSVSANVDSELIKWKRKLDQANREKMIQQEDYAKR